MADKNLFRNLGEYAKNVLDVNRDGRVSVGEFFSGLLPGNAIKIVLLTVDLLAILGEYRVWEVGMQITGNDPYAAAGFVAVSIVPFLLGQLMWLYPLANGWQQAIAVLMVVISLATSMQFGFADLTQSYNVLAISRMVTRLWMFYIVMLLLYVLADKTFRLARSAATARANAKHEVDKNETTRGVLESLRGSLAQIEELRNEFGDEAVEAGLLMLRTAGGAKQPRTRQNDKPNQPPALPAPGATSQPSQPGQKVFPHWEADALLLELHLNRDRAYKLLGNSPDQFYQNLKAHGIESIDISRKNFNKIYGQLRANGQVPARNP